MLGLYSYEERKWRRRVEVECHIDWDIIEINERIINNRNQLETIDSL
jgi:hypothetical protein